STSLSRRRPPATAEPCSQTATRDSPRQRRRTSTALVASTGIAGDRQVIGARFKPLNKKGGRKGRLRGSFAENGYLILPSLYSTCLRTTGSYFRTLILSVMVREFFLVT